TSVYNLNYHLIWGIKYRNKVLKGHVEEVLKQSLYDIASKYGCLTALAMEQYLSTTLVFAMNESWQFLHLRRCLLICNIVGQLSLIERYLMVW
ncbi:transposase, partial [Limosilactobacillus fermentum]